MGTLRSLSASGAIVALAASLGCAAAKPTGTNEDHVVGGTPVTEGYDAVGYLTYGFPNEESGGVDWSGFAFCTAGLVREDAFLTAGHCLDWTKEYVADGSMIFGLGFGEPQDMEVYELHSFRIHPYMYYAESMPAFHDIAVGFLREAVPEREPMALGSAVVDDPAPYEFVGYGRQWEGSWGRTEPMPPEDQPAPIEEVPDRVPKKQLFESYARSIARGDHARARQMASRMLMPWADPAFVVEEGDGGGEDGGGEDVGEPAEEEPLPPAPRRFEARMHGEHFGMIEASAIGGAVCWGDSGGPLMKKQADGSLAVVGVTSGLSPADGVWDDEMDYLGCYVTSGVQRDEFREYWTSVGHHMAWVEAVLAEPQGVFGCPAIEDRTWQEVAADRDQCFQYSDFENRGRWNLSFVLPGDYHLYAYVPSVADGVAEARYQLRAGGDEFEVLRNQAEPADTPEAELGAEDGFLPDDEAGTSGFMSLGIFHFEAGGDQWVELTLPQGEGAMDMLAIENAAPFAGCEAVADRSTACFEELGSVLGSSEGAHDYMYAACTLDMWAEEYPLEVAMMYNEHRQCEACLAEQSCGDALPGFLGGGLECEWVCSFRPRDEYLMAYVDPICGASTDMDGCDRVEGCSWFGCDDSCHAAGALAWEFCHDDANTCWGIGSRTTCSLNYGQCDWYACSDSCVPFGVPIGSVCGADAVVAECARRAGEDDCQRAAPDCLWMGSECTARESLMSI